jgi:hypothetical protein
LNELHDLRRRASKWSRDDDLRPSCLRLMGVILLNSKYDYFRDNIDVYIQQDLIPKPKVKPYIYDSVLQLLRGRFYPESLGNIRKRIMGKYQVSDCYAPQCSTRPAYEEGQDVIESRLTLLASKLFINRANNFGEGVIGTCVQIIVQMAVQSLRPTLRLISQLLDPSGADNTTKFQEFYLGIASLRAIMEGPFVPHGYKGREHEARQIIDDIARDFEAFLPQIFYSCDAAAGLDLRGKALGIRYPVDFESDDQKVSGGKLSRASGGHDDNFYDTISGATDSMISSRPPSPVVDRRDTLASLTPSGSMTDLSMAGEIDATTKVNEKVVGAVRSWFNSCTRSENTNLDVDAIITGLYVSSKKPVTSGGGKAKSFDIIVELLEQFIKLIPFMPAPELLGGQCFVGSYLIHMSDVVSEQVSIALQKVFIQYPNFRLGYVFAGVNQ